MEAGAVPSDLRLVDRRLVPYGPTLSGIEATYGGAPGRSIRLTSGGYLDEATESYDDLSSSGTLDQGRDLSVQTLAGTFRGRPVHAALWREPATRVPCDARAIVAVGLTAEEFEAVVHHSG